MPRGGTPQHEKCAGVHLRDRKLRAIGHAPYRFDPNVRVSPIAALEHAEENPRLIRDVVPRRRRPSYRGQADRQHPRLRFCAGRPRLSFTCVRWGSLFEAERPI